MCISSPVSLSLKHGFSDPRAGYTRDRWNRENGAAISECCLESTFMNQLPDLTDSLTIPSYEAAALSPIRAFGRVLASHCSTTVDYFYKATDPIASIHSLTAN